MQQLKEDESISDCNLEIYIKHLENFKEDFKVYFENLEKIHVPDWIVTLFDLEIENADIESHVEDELVDLYVNLEAKS